MLNVWFMFDNHTFERVKETTREGLTDRARKLFAEDGCGFLFVRDGQDASINPLTLHGHQLGNGQWGATVDEIETWADAVVSEISFRTIMA